MAPGETVVELVANVGSAGSDVPLPVGYCIKTAPQASPLASVTAAMQNHNPMLVSMEAEGMVPPDGAGLVGQLAFLSPAEFTNPLPVLPPAPHGLPVEKLVLHVL